MFVSFFPRPLAFVASAVLWGLHDRPLVRHRASARRVAGLSCPGVRRQDSRRRCILVAAIFVVLSLFRRDRFGDVVVGDPIQGNRAVDDPILTAVMTCDS